MYFSAAAVALLVVPFVAAAPLLSERHSCAQDSLSKVFQSNHHQAEDFCLDYIHVPEVTTTIHKPVKTVTKVDVSTHIKIIDVSTTKTKSVTKTSTQHVTVKKTSTDTVTRTHTITSKTTTTAVSTSTEIDDFDTTVTSDITSTTSTTAFTTSTVPWNTEPSEAPLVKKSQNPWSGKYNAAQLSSACSCLHLTKTKTVTSAPTSTKVIHSVKTVTSKKPVTAVKTHTVIHTVKVTTTSTKDVTSTSNSFHMHRTTLIQSTKTTTTTASTSTTVTTDVVATATSVTTSVAYCTATASFNIQAGADNERVGGDYGYLNLDYEGYWGIAFNFTSNFADAMAFSIDDDGHLFTIVSGVTLYAAQQPDDIVDNLYFATAAQIATQGSLYAQASIVDGVVKITVGDNTETTTLYSPALVMSRLEDEAEYGTVPVTLLAGCSVGVEVD